MNSCGTYGNYEPPQPTRELTLGERIVLAGWHAGQAQHTLSVCDKLHHLRRAIEILEAAA